MSEHKQANVVASAKSGMVVGGSGHRHLVDAKPASLIGMGVFALLALALLAVYLVHRSNTSPNHQAHVEVKSLQSQIKAQKGDDGSKISLYQQLAVACAKAGDTKCANDANNKVTQAQGAQDPGTLTTLAQTAAASGDKQKAISYYQKAIQALQKQDGGVPKPVTQDAIDNLQAEINKLQGTN